MNCYRYSLVLATVACLSVGTGTITGAIQQHARPREAILPRTSSGSQDSIRFDRTPMYEFINEMIRRLGIALVVVDGISPKQTVTLSQDAPVSRQQLLDLFIGALHDHGAVLVKSGMVHQIVPLSRDLGNTLERITNPAEIVSVPRGGASVLMWYAGAALSDFCAAMADTLGITPIVIDPAVQGTVTICSSGPITQEMVFPILAAVLENNDARIVQCEGRYEVVPVSSSVPPACEILIHQPAPRLPHGTQRQRIVLRPDELESHIVSRVEPKQFLSAAEQALSGKVTLEIMLDERGDIDVLRVWVPAASALNEATIKAVRQWRFAPFMGPDGFPKQVRGMLTIVFNPSE